MKIIITGFSGFIGYHLCNRIFYDQKYKVTGVDNFNNYYDPVLKKDRFKILKPHLHNHYNCDISNQSKIFEIIDYEKPDIIIHLAAQAGVRYSLINPREYVNSNLVGFFNILEFCKRNKVENFIFASSSSVYGGNKKFPFHESHNIDHPVSFYGATKKANEILAHSYSHLFQIPSTGLRFFTVYGPWGRPDMAPMIFADAMLNNREFDVYNYGEMTRDFTYIDDVIETIFRCCFKPATSDTNFNPENTDPSTSNAPFRIFNVGNNKPIKLIDFINLLASKLGKNAKKNFLEMQKGDVKITLSDSTKIKEWINFSPNTSIEIGIEKFANWYIDFYEKSKKDI